MNASANTIERPITAVLSSIIDNVQEIVRSEVRLAKREIREELSEVVYGAAWLATATLSAFFAVSFLLGAAFFALSILVPHWAAALIIAGALALISGIAFGVRASKSRQITKHQLELSGPHQEGIP